MTTTLQQLIDDSVFISTEHQARLAELEKPTHGAPMQRFASVDTGLFDSILRRYGGMPDDEICLPGEEPGAKSQLVSLAASASRTAEN